MHSPLLTPTPLLPPELVLIVQRLAGIASDCGLSDMEVELLLHLSFGGWDRMRRGIGPAPDERRERRLRFLLDLLVIAWDLRGGVEGVAEWLRLDRPGGRSVLLGLIEDEELLMWLRRELLREHRQRFPSSGR